MGNRPVWQGAEVNGTAEILQGRFALWQSRDIQKPVFKDGTNMPATTIMPGCHKLQAVTWTFGVLLVLPPFVQALTSSSICATPPKASHNNSSRIEAAFRMDLLDRGAPAPRDEKHGSSRASLTQLVGSNANKNA
ncbi:hypothetical protein CPLU01_13281 [Colletotrichum plurivorum]|uniref:Uncharacterized protein n=1 Tax=Colletotrichum plurivorum TaxID=2175906 RepID=A0A8H6JSF4_9PEZI|nr:hypothetical protein CPLU01_13281 [Colletotrichum plurivorum]